MDEAGDATVGLSIYILLALWWAFVSAVSLFSADIKVDGKTQAQSKVVDAVRKDDAGPDKNAESQSAAAFDEAAFLEGAQRAYEMILSAFAEGSLEILRPLLADDVLQCFATEIARRRDTAEVLDLTFIGLSHSRIEERREEAGTLEIDVRFEAEAVRATRDEDGRLLSGAPNQIVAMRDLWTFRRESADAAWLLIATDEA